MTFIMRDPLLDDAIKQAHDNHDYGLLTALYTEAAELCEMRDDQDAACFYLTHAFVFALQEGAEEAEILQRRLFHYGREPAPSDNEQELP